MSVDAGVGALESAMKRQFKETLVVATALSKIKRGGKRKPRTVCLTTGPKSDQARLHVIKRGEGESGSQSFEIKHSYKLKALAALHRADALAGEGAGLEFEFHGAPTLAVTSNSAERLLQLAAAALRLARNVCNATPKVDSDLVLLIDSSAGETTRTERLVLEALPEKPIAADATPLKESGERKLLTATEEEALSAVLSAYHVDLSGEASDFTRLLADEQQRLERMHVEDILRTQGDCDQMIRLLDKAATQLGDIELALRQHEKRVTAMQKDAAAVLRKL